MFSSQDDKKIDVMSLHLVIKHSHSKEKEKKYAQIQRMVIFQIAIALFFSHSLKLFDK